MILPADKKTSLINTARPKPAVQLALDGKPIYLHNFLATVKVAREEQDMSGQKSSTKKSDKGVKAKTLSVSGLIPFREKQWLSDLFNLAESVDSKGEQKKYRVTNISAEAVNMREVQFSGEISAVEQNVQGWNVSFTLREVNSVAEKKEQRQKKPQAKVQSEKAPVATQQNSSTSSQAQSEAKPSPKDDSFWGWLNNDVIGS